MLAQIMSYRFTYHEKKIVTLFPHNCHVSQFKPYWSSLENVKIFQEKVNVRPSYSPVENPKSINKICPEDVASAILSLVGVKTFRPEYKTVHIGKSFKQPRIESRIWRSNCKYAPALLLPASQSANEF